MKVIKLHCKIQLCPIYFYNFYKHYQARGVDFYDERAEPVINKLLSLEPCSVKIIKDYIDVYGSPDLALEFATEDDFTIFALRWA
jgi:hypothetical protein